MQADDERRELRAWRSRQALAVCVLGVVLVPLLALVVIAIARDLPNLFRSPLILLLPVCLVWLWLLGRAPGRWLKAGADERAGDIRSVRGEVIVDARRGVGLIAPSRYALRVRNEMFEIGEFWAAQLIPGKTYTVRYAPRSRAVVSIARQGASADAGDAVEIDLTRRERDLLRLIAEGLTDKEIARELNLSPATVRTYNSDLYAKLGISRRTQAVPIADRLGLTSQV
ncbi:response regulator transcription factor [Maricaulis sp.]|uniref:helix-turn-helix transcriptional regulator n=1 Tax=Maricaulis sp. TaxID=1486257 RepID=UPI0032975F47